MVGAVVMNVEPDSTTQTSPRGATATTDASGGDSGSAQSPLLSRISGELPDGSPRFAARAPGRLDVMGGLAEYTGSLVLNTAIADHACVAVQRRSDGILSIVLAQAQDRDGGSPFEIATTKLREADGTVIRVEEGRRLVPSTVPSSVSCVLGAVVELARDQFVGPLETGVSVAVASTLDGLRDAGRDSALAAATIVAVTASWDATVSVEDVAGLCQRVENEWLQTPVGIADAVCALSSIPSVLLQIHCDARKVGGTIPLPEHLTLMGIDCGVPDSDARIRYERVRTAAFMGRALIDRIIQHDRADDLNWDGFLAKISVTDYVERFRDRLPTKLKGVEYLDRFGETGDPLTRIDPTFTYKIRSRTEHHIYEHARACQFAECLSRGTRTGDERALHEAGELMYASHWSYGQRCGLGSVESDLLVNLVRKHGAEAGVFGAKVSARGCGGVVTVLMQSTERADTAIREALRQYEARAERKATIVRGSSPGALVSGVHKF